MSRVCLYLAAIFVFAAVFVQCCSAQCFTNRFGVTRCYDRGVVVNHASPFRVYSDVYVAPPYRSSIVRRVIQTAPTVIANPMPDPVPNRVVVPIATWASPIPFTRVYRSRLVCFGDVCHQ